MLKFLYGADASDLPASYDRCTHAFGRIVRALPVVLVLATLPIGVSAKAQGLSRAEVFRRAAALRDVGAQLFFDPLLSANGQQACASCHDPNHDFGPPDARPAQPGGLDGKTPGLRAVPSLKYLQDVPPFSEHYHTAEDEGDESIDNGPTGGLNWDGRDDDRRRQAQTPLTASFEMANPDLASVGVRLARSAYAAPLRAAAGLPTPAPGQDDSAAVLQALLEALDAYQQDGALFYPYTSKYDAYLAGKARLTPAEQRGLDLFNDENKGNCASCHPSQRGNDGSPPHFSDYGMVALGVPRNPRIPANADPAYADLGLCGPLRTDLAGHGEYCGTFRTPGLRNVARRAVFMHNGVFTSLEQVLDFYAERDTNPERWYPKDAKGRVRKFDDLPAAYHANVNTEAPFGGKRGAKPMLSKAERRDIIAFLKTLNDDWVGQ